MSDAWNEIQAVRSKKNSRLAKLAARKKEREGLVAELLTPLSGSAGSDTKSPQIQATIKADTSKESVESLKRSSSPAPSPKPTVNVPKEEPIKHDPEVEKKLLYVLCDLEVDHPVSSATLADKTTDALGRKVQLPLIENLLQKFAAQQLIRISTDANKSDGHGKFDVISIDLTKLSAVHSEVQGERSKSIKRKRDEAGDDGEEKQPASKQTKLAVKADISLESLLTAQSAKEKESKQMAEEIRQLLSAPTTKEKILVERFKSQGGVQLQEFCQYGTKEECAKLGQVTETCKKLHFRKIIHKHTDESLGDCSFLNTCFHMDTCKYVHYEINFPEKSKTAAQKKDQQVSSVMTESGEQVNMFPPQWIQCDMRYLDMSTLGKCAVIMADPPWDIHMELPYGTMSDDEMRRLPVPVLQDDGFIFLWVTGRAMELGRECLELWGYKRIDEIIWVKTNQLQRIIRTGRTGHWLNHGKEHCLVGCKGSLKGVNKGLDCDVIVAEVRATSHKPDEIYGIIERLSPGTRKVELFGRPHNVQPNWITLGNQLEGVRLVDPDVVGRFREKYPDGNCLEPPKNREKERERDREGREREQFDRDQREREHRERFLH